MYQHLINIHGVPRSGTSWLGEIFNSAPGVRYKYQPLYRKPLRGMIGPQSRREDLEHYFRLLYGYANDFIDRRQDVAMGIAPHFERKDPAPAFLVSKHVRHHYLVPRLLALLPEMRMVGIVRHPCAVLHSWRRTPWPTYDPAWDFLAEWRFAPRKNRYRPEWYYGFHRWQEVAAMFLDMQRTYPRRFRLLRYEELVADTGTVVTDLFAWCNLPLTEQTERFLQRSRAATVDDAYSVFRRTPDIHAWRGELDPSVVRAVETELAGGELERFLGGPAPGAGPRDEGV